MAQKTGTNPKSCQLRQTTGRNPRSGERGKYVFIMKNKIILLSLFTASSFLFSFYSPLKTKISISCSEQDAQITVDGKGAGTGSAVITVPSDGCTTVKVEKLGFVGVEREYCESKSVKLPKSDYIKLEADEAYASSISLDVANNDVTLLTSKSESDAFKVISQIVQSYFDVIEVTDKETGYLRTSWVGQTFRSGAIRTRIIIKAGGTNPLSYKVKLVSEICGDPRVSIKSDESFKSWDRVLRKYENLIPELQSRLK